jgi:demethylmenaquinone methyltransferase/2-methoxy-6-polyprenyl-1,4-benzoquinol methylase
LAPDVHKAVERYRRHAAGYDRSCRRTMGLRARVIGLLGLRPGERVLDVASGTGLSFELLRAGVGEQGMVVGVEASPDMMRLARERVAARRWRNVCLIEAALESAALPGRYDAILFNYTHDVLQSEAALDNIFRAARPGARVAVCGVRSYPWWLAPANLYVWLKAAPYLTTFEGLRRPWARLERYVPRLVVSGIHLGSGYVAHGRVPAPSGHRP